MHTTFTKTIRYDRETRDYAMYLDGELVGFARTYHEAEITLDQLVYELLCAGLHLSAAQLDSGSDADAMAAEVAGMVANDATQLEPVDPFVPLGVCTICGCAAWTTTADGLLCPDHANVLDAWVADALPAGWMRMPEGDILDADGMRVR